MIYGNPAKQHIELVQHSLLIQQWESQGILQPLLQIPYPCEITTQAELWQLVQRTATVDSDRLAYINDIDEFLFDAWADLLSSFGIQVSGDIVYSQIQVYEPIIDYLKLHYNRPRPFQTAGYYNIPLYPLVDCGSTDSAYPSGHTLFSLFIYHYYVARYPHLRKPLMAFVLDVKSTREDGGVHYPSDGLFSFQVYQHLKRFLFPTIENPYGLQQQNRVNPPPHY